MTPAPKLLAAVAALAAACGPIPSSSPDLATIVYEPTPAEASPVLAFASRYGTLVLLRGSNTLTKQEFDSVLGQWVEAVKYVTRDTFQWTDDELFASLDGLAVVVDSTPYACISEPWVCTGYAFPWTRVVFISYAPDKPLCKSPLWHELVHNALYVIEGQQPSHNSTLWAKLATRHCN